MADSLVFLVMIAPVVSRQLAGRREFWCFTSRWEHLIFSSDDILSFSSTWSTQTESIVRRNRSDFNFPKPPLGENQSILHFFSALRAKHYHASSNKRVRERESNDGHQKKRPRREKTATTKPRDAIVVEHILNQMGAEHFEPRVVNQGLEFIYRYVGDVLEEAKVYQRHRIGYDVANNEGGESIVDGGDGGEAMMMNLEEMKKNSVSVKDVRLASRVILAREFAANDALESAESLQKACAKLNEKPMPKLLERPGIRVPQDDNLLNENYEIGPRRGKEGEAQMREARERDRKRREQEEKERMEMLTQLQGGIAPSTELTGGDAHVGVQFNVKATKAIEVTTEKAK